MAIYDILKDAVDIAQKAQNAELLQKLFDAQQQALQLLEENFELKDALQKTQDIKALEDKIERIPDSFYITISDDEQKIKYCSACWDSTGKTIQIYKTSTGSYRCQICGVRSVLVKTNVW